MWHCYPLRSKRKEQRKILLRYLCFSLEKSALSLFGEVSSLLSVIPVFLIVDYNPGEQSDDVFPSSHVQAKYFLKCSSLMQEKTVYAALIHM